MTENFYDPSELNLPVLIYIAKEHCPACIRYQPEWEEVKRRLNGRARFVKFNCDPPYVNVPPCLAKYGTWFPSIILAGPNSYFREYTPDDQVNKIDHRDGYTIKAKKYNAVETASGYQYAGRGNTADGTVMWFNQVVNNVLNNDEPTPPQIFSTRRNRSNFPQNNSFSGYIPSRSIQNQPPFYA